MNERIQQMIHSLNEKKGVHWTNEDKIQFAELIIRKCAKLAGDCPDSYLRQSYKSVSTYVKEHFGVE